MPDSPIVSFYTLIPDGRPPERADRAAGGILPTRAFRFCEPVTTASAFGWHIFPPMGLSLIWDGSEVAWTYEGADGWFTLKAAQFPGFAERFDKAVPDDLKGFSPPFLSALPEPGLSRSGSGFIVGTAPGWSLLIRPTANVPKSQSYEMYEGLIETDQWFGPLFINMRLTRTHVPIDIDPEFPLFQVQPVHRAPYGAHNARREPCRIARHERAGSRTTTTSRTASPSAISPRKRAGNAPKDKLVQL